MPDIFIAIWDFFKAEVAPVLMGILPVISPFLFKWASDLSKKTSLNMTDISTKLVELLNKEDGIPQLKEIKGAVANAISSVDTLSEMFTLLFENANIEPEAKAKMKSLVDKIKAGSTEDRIKELELANAHMLELLKVKSVEEVVKVVEVPIAEVERVRR